MQDMLNILISLAIFLILYYLVFYVSRPWARKFRSDVAIVTIKTSQIPVTIIGIAGFLKLFLAKLSTEPSIQFLERGLSAIIVLASTVWILRLVKQVVIYTLKQFAQRSEEQWDDVLIPFIEATLPVIAYAAGAVFFLQAIGIDTSGLIAALGGLSLIIGFSLQPTLTNFFSGLFLLIDSPFQFGDIIALPSGQAVIKKIGLRLTTLYVIEQHCDLYMPNSAMQAQSITNVVRPTPYYYYNLQLSVSSDADPSRIVQLIESVILAHPDTLGNTDQKLEKLESFYGVSNALPMATQKRETAKLRLLAEQEVNKKLIVIEEALTNLSDRVSQMEEGGLNANEIRQIKGDFLSICRQVGLDIAADPKLRRQKLELVEIASDTSEKTLIHLIRDWYKAWVKDPSLLYKDRISLPQEWERRINLLKLKFNKAFKRVNNISTDETRLDTLVSDIRTWMKESFKTTRNEWQNSKVWVDNFSSADRSYNVRFYVDNVALEHYQRGQRVKSEINQELTWQLRQAYLAV
jgi:MscS family membrane protein